MHAGNKALLHPRIKKKHLVLFLLASGVGTQHIIIGFDPVLMEAELRAAQETAE